MHAVLLASCTLTKLYVYTPDVPVGTATVTLLLLPVVLTVSGLPLLIVYVNVYGAVPPAPVNVILGVALFWHTAVVPPIVAVGNALTLTTCVILSLSPQLLVTTNFTL